MRAAYFDVDGTLAATSSVTPLVWFRRRRGELLDWLWFATLPLRAMGWIIRYRINNAAGNRATYRSYRGFDAAKTRADAPVCFEQLIKPRLISTTVRRLRSLQADGVKIVFVTGALDFIMQPLANFFNAELIAPGLEESNGRFTGELTRDPLTGPAKAVAVRAHAEAHGIDLSASYAFGNEWGDRDMLAIVGHPVAVQPEPGLRKLQ